MASGEMSRDAFIAFLHRTLGAAAKASVDGAVTIAGMDDIPNDLAEKATAWPQPEDCRTARA